MSLNVDEFMQLDPSVSTTAENHSPQTSFFANNVIELPHSNHNTVAVATSAGSFNFIPPQGAMVTTTTIGQRQHQQQQLMNASTRPGPLMLPAAIAPVTSTTATARTPNPINLQLLPHAFNSTAPQLIGQEPLIYNSNNNNNMYRIQDKLYNTQPQQQQLWSSNYAQTQQPQPQQQTFRGLHLSTSPMKFQLSHAQAAQAPSLQPQQQQHHLYISPAPNPSGGSSVLQENGKISSTTTTTASPLVEPNLITLESLMPGVQYKLPTNVLGGTSCGNGSATTTSSTVLVDGINICINNHYTNSAAGAAMSLPLRSSAPSLPPPSALDTMERAMVVPAPSSPVIGPIQHNAPTPIVINQYISDQEIQIVPPATPTHGNDEPDSTTVNTPAVSSPSERSFEDDEEERDDEIDQHRVKVTDVIDLSADEICYVNPLQQEQHPKDQDKPAVEEGEVKKDEAQSSKEPPDVQSSESQDFDDLVRNAFSDSPTPSLLSLEERESKKEQALRAVINPVVKSIIRDLPKLKDSPSPTPPPSSSTTEEEPSTKQEFKIGEDVFVERPEDGERRLYLGTVILYQAPKYLVRFDDRSELWCWPREMRRLGGGGDSGLDERTTEKDSPQKEKAKAQSSMCIACKQFKDDDPVEICERCSRGYHRSCTRQTYPDSGHWICKRCNKPMRWDCDKTRDLIEHVKRQGEFEYNTHKLTWDKLHRVNEEQIYCYCGKSGEFYNNMLQCCKCRNWFHTQCMVDRMRLLLGDAFFVFCCAVCNKGQEYVRRLQMTWVDMAHLGLYNLSHTRFASQQKYQNIYRLSSFLLAERLRLPIPQEWKSMSENVFRDNVRRTLRANPKRFVSGRETKKDPNYWGLRQNGPPPVQQIHLSMNQVLNDEYLASVLKLSLHQENERSQEPVGEPKPQGQVINEQKNGDTKQQERLNEGETEEEDEEEEDEPLDYGEFRVSVPKNLAISNDGRRALNANKTVGVAMKLPQDNDVSEDSDKFTSDDEMPIKKLIEKSTEEKLDISGESNSTEEIFEALKKSPSYEHRRQAAIKVAAVEATAAKQEQESKGKSDSAETTNKTHDKSTAPRSLPERSTRSKRKTFQTRSASATYKQNLSQAAATATKRCNTTTPAPSDQFPYSDESSTGSSSHGVGGSGSASGCGSVASPGGSISLDDIIPPPENFLGSNNPFVTITPKKQQPPLAPQPLLPISLAEKLNSLRSAARGGRATAGQPRILRTIKRKLSANDITIGPNQEVRIKRKRRSPSDKVEVINTTALHSGMFPLYAKDMKIGKKFSTVGMLLANPSLGPGGGKSNGTSTSGQIVKANKILTAPSTTASSHGRLLRQRPSPKSLTPTSSESSSRRSSVSSVSGPINCISNLPSSSSSSCTPVSGAAKELQNFQPSIGECFGVAPGSKGRFDEENFIICAKRMTSNGQMQYLLEYTGPKLSKEHKEHQAEHAKGEGDGCKQDAALKANSN